MLSRNSLFPLNTIANDQKLGKFRGRLTISRLGIASSVFGMLSMAAGLAEAVVTTPKIWIKIYIKKSSRHFNMTYSQQFCTDGVQGLQLLHPNGRFPTGKIPIGLREYNVFDTNMTTNLMVSICAQYITHEGTWHVADQDENEETTSGGLTRYVPQMVNDKYPITQGNYNQI